MADSKLLKIALGLITAGTVLFLAGSVKGGSGLMINKDFQILSPEDLKTYTYSDGNMEPFESVNIDISNVPVTFLPSQDGKYGAEVCYWAAGQDAVRVAVENKILVIEEEDKGYWFSFDLSFITGKERTGESVTVYLPEGSYEKICVKSSNAPVTMKNTGVDVQELSLKTSNAAVQVSDIRTENMEIGTSNASVVLDEICFQTEQSSITVGTSNGKISLHLPENGKETCQITASTSNAAIYVNDEKMKNSKYVTEDGRNILHLKTSNGKIELFFGKDK